MPLAEASEGRKNSFLTGKDFRKIQAQGGSAMYAAVWGLKEERHQRSFRDATNNKQDKEQTTDQIRSKLMT